MELLQLVAVRGMFSHVAGQPVRLGRPVPGAPGQREGEEQPRLPVHPVHERVRHRSGMTSQLPLGLREQFSAYKRFFVLVE